MDDDSLREANEHLNALGQLAAGVGHHVINAFSAIVSNAEILRLLPDSPRSFDPTATADIIIQTALDASGVARRLIDYSRAATSTGDSMVCLATVAERVMSERKEDSSPGIDWEFRAAPVPPIPGSAIQIQVMLNHLIANAKEALSPRGGVIRLDVNHDERGWIVLDVRDDGVGMSARELERAIEPFFTAKPGHLGVGLSIANGIWRRHRGTLAIRSEPGSGTCVRLSIEPPRPRR